MPSLSGDTPPISEAPTSKVLYVASLMLLEVRLSSPVSQLHLSGPTPTGAGLLGCSEGRKPVNILCPGFVALMKAWLRVQDMSWQYFGSWVWD